MRLNLSPWQKGELSKMEQKKLTQGPLLDKKGNLAEAGYHTALVRSYNRKDIRASRLRIKEWDYYYLQKGDLAFALTVADNGYMAMVSVSILDFAKPGFLTVSRMKAFPMGRLHMPASSKEGTVHCKTRDCELIFDTKDGVRHLRGAFVNYGPEKATLTCDFTLTEEPRDSMVIATPFEKPRRFYYNQKICGMRVKGSFSYSGKEIDLTGGLATLDWGRGVWTYQNTWYWSCLSADMADGHTFAMNLGYGFGDTSAASENMLFFDGVAHKLGRVQFEIPQNADGTDDFLSPWRITDSEGRLDLEMRPIFDRKDYVNALVVSSNQHQVFGRFYGTATLDGGEKITLSGEIGFAEKVKNKW